MAQAWNDSNTKPHVRAVAAEIRDKFVIGDIGGYRSGPDAQDHGLGLALDVMTSIKGQAVADWAVANYQRLAITYVIWARRIWDHRNGRGWEAYRGSSPHTDHVHISFHPTPGPGGPIVEAPGDTSPNEGCAGFLLRLLGITAANMPPKESETTS
jgi:hypothetical protein